MESRKTVKELKKIKNGKQIESNDNILSIDRWNVQFKSFSSSKGRNKENKNRTETDAENAINREEERQRERKSLGKKTEKKECKKLYNEKESRC